MKTTALILALAMAAPAWAQDKPPEKPADEVAKPETPKPRAPSKHSSKRMEDARHCLDKPSNTEIIKCAEAYL